MAGNFRRKKVVTISDLNDDCLLQIFYKLPMGDLLNVAQTISRFRELGKFVFPKLCFWLDDVERLYEIYSKWEANDILHNIRKLTIILNEEHPLINKIDKLCNKLQELTIRDGGLEFVHQDTLIKWCQNITSLHLIWFHMDASFMKGILLKNKGQLKVLSIQHCSLHDGETTFLGDLKNLKKISFEYPRISFDPNIVIEFLDNNSDTLEHLDIRTDPSILNETVISKISSKFHNLKTICIDYHENGIDISPIATIPTLKRVYVLSDLLNCEVINTFCDNLARTNSVEYLRVALECSKIVGPSTKMNSLKCLILDQCDDWRDFHFENLPELEELWICSPRTKMTVNAIKTILHTLPKLKTLMISKTLKKKQCMALEKFLAEQNRKLVFEVNDDVFSKLMDNPDDFKFLILRKMDYTFSEHISPLND